MVILDFYGLPGSGKSEISHALAEKLRDSGYSVKEPSWILDMRYGTLKRLAVKLYKAISYSTGHLKQLRSILALSNIPKRNLSQSLKMWVNLAYTLNYENSNNVDFLIMDEGIAQAVISLYTEAKAENYKICYNYIRNLVNNSVIPVYVNVKTDVALARLSKRKNGKSRLDELDGSKRMEMTERINSICSHLDYEAFVVKNDKEVDDAVDKISDYLQRNEESWLR